MDDLLRATALSTFDLDLRESSSRARASRQRGTTLERRELTDSSSPGRRRGTSVTDKESMGNGEREARETAHQLMEAAINNRTVVYHSDPRLILVVARSSDPRSTDSLIVRRLAPSRAHTGRETDSPVKPTRTRPRNALPGPRSGGKFSGAEDEI